MNDQTQTEAHASENEAPTEAPQPGTTEDAFTLADVEKRFFGPGELEGEASEYLELIGGLGVNVTMNYDPEAEFPDGYGLAVLPIAKRGADGMETIGVCVAAIPDPSTVAETENGQAFIKDVVAGAFMAKVANSVRPRSDGTSAGSIPFSIADFIENRRGRESLKTFSDLAPAYVKALRQKGIKFMTATLLRSALQSASFASAQFPKIEQANWEMLLNTMVSDAGKKGLDAAILNNWLATRNEAEDTTADEIDFGDFANMV